MTVCLTGDVHHMSLETRDQAYMDRTELDVAIEYAEIAGEYGVPVTLFVTGKAAVEEPNRVRRLVAMDHVEIGGHGYYAFDTPIHTAWRGLGKLTRGFVGSWNGPKWFQQWEIRRTKSTLTDLGATVTSWRDHAYRHDSNTASLLASAGIERFSDSVGPDERVQNESGVTVLPVNTPPDHEHIYHAFRKRGSDAVQQFRGPFGGNSVEPEEWVDWVADQAATVLADDGVATILAHPSCLWLADEFESLYGLCEWISDREPLLMREINAHRNTERSPQSVGDSKDSTNDA